MRILTKDSHKSYFNMIRDKSLRAMAEIGEEFDALKNIKEWNFLKQKLYADYIAAYPKELFEKRKLVDAQKVSEYNFKNYRVENYLFESLAGWYVNATLYLPKEKGKYPGIVCPTGHSSKTFPNYTSSAQLIARSGYIAISFDPPGMKGEHIFGNDHFEDGARGYLSGFWSNTFFVIDAIRCLDFLETREDVIQGKGFGMTGTSGGGATSIHTSIIDDRVKCIAPVCCISDEIDKIFNNKYTYCPEEKGYGHLISGIKDRSLLSLVAPKPCLVCAGALDEVYEVKMAEKTVNNVKKIYDFYDEGEIDCFIDYSSGHKFSVDQINEVIKFFDKNLKGESRTYLYAEKDIEYPEREKILCRPDDITSMYTMNLERFRNAKNRKKLDAKRLAKLTETDARVIPLSVFCTEGDWLLWDHRLKTVIYAMDEHIDVPALLLERNSQPSDRIVIYADDVDKWDKLENNGFLTQKSGFMTRTPYEYESSVLSIDITGVGELKSEPFPYDLAGWARSDRLESYVSIALGTSVLSTQINEVLAVFNNEYENGSVKITAAGKGVAALPVLIASAIFGKCKKVVLENLPISFESIAETVPNDFCPMSIIYNAPEKFEIYEVAHIVKNLILVNPIFANGKKVPMQIAREYFGEKVEIIYNDTGIMHKLL